MAEVQSMGDQSESAGRAGPTLPVDLARIRPEHNERRFYRLLVIQDLFDGHTLVREWGRIGQPGQVRTEQFPTARAAQVALRVIAARKRRRGYLDRRQ
jgi:predicted DNA-binding WGR domain protein